MSKSKSQNSIIALATLGVYLGLLLAGGTPGVLAQQAALTKEFSVKDEIEVKDDLDTKPKDQPLKDQSSYLDDFVVAYSDFYLASYKNNVRINKEISAECPAFCVLHKLDYFPTFSPDLKRLFGITNYSVRFDWAGDNRISKMEIHYSPSHGELNYLHNAFASPTARWTTTTHLIAEKTEVTLKAENGHLVVTTRLPRGSLDSLLAADAK